MLARHLLFLATRRPKKVLLVIQSTDTISTSACPQQQQQQQQPQNIHQHQHQQQHQPPPYVGPPQVQAIYEDYTYHQTAAVYNNNRSQGQQRSLQPQLRQSVPLKNNNNNNNNLHHHHQPYHHPNIHDIVDPYQQLIYEKSLQHRQPTYFTENQKLYAQQQQKQQQQQQQLYSKSQSQQQFYTLPNRRAQREVILEPPRSITPDITRGLGRGPLSAMHMLARQGQKSNSAEKLVMHHHGQAGYNCQMDLNKKNLEQFEARCRLAAQQQQQQQKLAPVDVKNRFASPLGLSALGYRFFASPIQDSLKTAPISPIGPEHANGFKSSTPTGGRVAPTVAERLALSSQRCASPNPALMQHNADNKQQLSDSGRSTPTNLILSPIKSTMSNEELFAAIHKSKRRLNIKDDPESLSPAGSVTSLNAKGQQAGTRHSWSPESQKVPEIPKTVLSPSATSRMDFKRLLLQQSIKAGPARISAAEQLKLSRQQCQDSYQQQSPQHQQYQQPQQQSPQKPNQMPLTKVLSPRSAWRFQTPRTDVLSSTIIEDTAAEEKAMKPSPDTPSPVSRLPTTTTRRQLDMSEEKPAKTLEEVKNAINETRSQRSLEKREKELENRLQAIDSSSKKQQPPATDDDAIDPVKAIESRRMSNQLARAQFLASSTPASTSSSSSSAAHKDLFSRRFRARSESPQQNNPQRALTASPTAGDGATVTRSPSAPALETAL